jgi:tetratricopeptide (TPR) repeat protein
LPANRTWPKTYNQYYHMNNGTHTEILIQYFDGELEGEQLSAVRKLIDENPSIREEYERLSQAREAIKSYGLKNKIGSIHQEMMQELKKEDDQHTSMVRKMIRYSVRIAAIILVALGSITFYQYMTCSPEKLFRENYLPFSIHETRGIPSSTLEVMYKKGDISEVITAFNALKDPMPGDYFLAGNAFLEIHQPSNAVRAFTALQENNKANNSHYFEEDAEYYLAMAYLAGNDPGKAIPIFEKINSDNGHAYHSKVTNWFMARIHRLKP